MTSIEERYRQLKDRTPKGKVDFAIEEGGSNAVFILNELGQLSLITLTHLIKRQGLLHEQIDDLVVANPMNIIGLLGLIFKHAVEESNTGIASRVIDVEYSILLAEALSSRSNTDVLYTIFRDQNWATNAKDDKFLARLVILLEQRRNNLAVNMIIDGPQIIRDRKQLLSTMPSNLTLTRQFYQELVL